MILLPSCTSNSSSIQTLSCWSFFVFPILGLLHSPTQTKLFFETTLSKVTKHLKHVQQYTHFYVVQAHVRERLRDCICYSGKLSLQVLFTSENREFQLQAPPCTGGPSFTITIGTRMFVTKGCGH